MVRSTSLSLGIPSNASPISSNVTSPTDPGSHPSTPGSTAGGRTQEHTLPQSRLNYTELQISSRPAEGPPLSPEFTSLPPFPESPGEFARAGIEPPKGFFANLKASKSSNKVNNVSDPTIRQVPEDTSRRDIDVLENPDYARKTLASTPDLRLPTPDPEATGSLNQDLNSLAVDEPKISNQVERERVIPRRPVGSPTRSNDGKGGSGGPETLQVKKPKPRFGNLINRTSGLSGLSGPQKGKSVNPIITSTQPSPQLQMDGANDDLSRSNMHSTPNTPLTAPLPQERPAFNERSLVPGSNRIPSPRTRSAERSQTRTEQRPDPQYVHSGLNNSSSGQFREGPTSSSHLFHNIKNTSSRAAGGLNKAGKGIFAKMGRSGSNTVVAQEDPRYVCQIINLPLVEQTRKTRIAARLENSKDKTEFWMPALPWRCIDYLNFRGCEEEGLYRVPGSDREIRLWQKRFDQEGDINLFDEDNLYDINIIGSLFKSWLRELPTEIFPKATQTKIYQENPDAVEVPQMLKDELSLLPPWNYYLLFAITCHLSLLTAYSDKNRMTYGNLVICFQPCLKIDNFCFQFLVQHWRECWQGCWTEKDALEEEYRVMDGREVELPGSSGNSSGGSTAVGGEERPTGSSASNKPMYASRSQQMSSHQPQQQQQQQQQQRQQQQHEVQQQVQQQQQQQQSRGPQLTLSTENGDHVAVPNDEQASSNAHARDGSRLPELAPMQPLSPIGF